MKNKIKLVILSIAVMMFAGISVYAAEIPYSVKYDYSNQKLTISGDSLTDGEWISVQILKPGMTIAEDGNEAVLYRRQNTVKDGKYTFIVEYGDINGECSGVLASSGKEGITHFDVVIVSKDELKVIYDEINTAAKEDNFSAFLAVVNDNIKELTGSVNAEGNLSSELENFFNYVKQNELKYDKSSQNTDILNTFLVIDELNSGDLENIQEVIDIITIDEELVENYRVLAKTEGMQKFFTDRLSGRSIKDLEKFDSVFKEAIILTAAKYGSAYGELKEAVDKYGSSIGITGSASTAVYKSLLGKEYATGTAFKKAYDNAVKAANKGSSSGAGGSSGQGTAGRGTAASKVPAAAVVGADEILDNIPEAVSAEFNDIEGVTWASEAILALADMGIINGKGDGRFKPDDNVTREEFVKILIGALGISDYAYGGNIFADVSDSDWFCKYVNIAYENNIVDGIGDGKFGVGESITRQDMAVMLYNALLFRDAQITAEELTFEDKSDISDYAYEAVSVLYGMGAINGVSETRFEPTGTATRAQAAKVVYAVLKQLQ